jgi:hypothetical protein
MNNSIENKLVSMREFVLSSEAWMNDENKIDTGAYSWNVRRYAQLLGEKVKMEHMELFQDLSKERIKVFIDSRFTIERLVPDNLAFSAKGLKIILRNGAN